METIQLFTADLRYTDEMTPIVPPEGREGDLIDSRAAGDSLMTQERRGMRSDLLVLATAAAAVVCCLGLSLLVAAGGTALLGLAGVALPMAMLIGIGGWAACYLRRRG